MKEQIINYQINKIPYTKPIKDTYVLKKKTRKPSRIIKALLSKGIIEPYKEPAVKFERVVIDKTKVIELIYHLQRDIYYNANKKPIQVIIGYDKFKQLETECFEEFRFSMPMEMQGSEGRKIFDMEIILNPRIDGLVLL